MHMHMHMCTCAHAHVHMHMCTWTCAHAHVHMHMCTCTCAHALAHVHIACNSSQCDTLNINLFPQEWQYERLVLVIYVRVCRHMPQMICLSVWTWFCLISLFNYYCIFLSADGVVNSAYFACDSSGGWYNSSLLCMLSIWMLYFIFKKGQQINGKSSR